MTFDEVDRELTLPRYNALCRFWKKHPPSAILLAGYVGYNSGEEAAPKVSGDGTTPVKGFDWDAAPVVEEMDSESMGMLGTVFGMPMRIR